MSNCPSEILCHPRKVEKTTVRSIFQPTRSSPTNSFTLLCYFSIAFLISNLFFAWTLRSLQKSCKCKIRKLQHKIRVSAPQITKLSPIECRFHLPHQPWLFKFAAGPAGGTPHRQHHDEVAHLGGGAEESHHSQHGAAAVQGAEVRDGRSWLPCTFYPTLW